MRRQVRLGQTRPDLTEECATVNPYAQTEDRIAKNDRKHMKGVAMKTSMITIAFVCIALAGQVHAEHGALAITPEELERRANTEVMDDEILMLKELLKAPIFEGPLRAMCTLVMLAAKNGVKTEMSDYHLSELQIKIFNDMLKGKDQGYVLCMVAELWRGTEKFDKKKAL